MREGLLDAVSAITAEVGRMVHKRWRGSYKRWEKLPGQPVCDVDLEADALLRERLGTLDPEAGWLSEETADSAERLTRVRVWVVDPIDGTRDFVRGREGWAVSVALVEGGRPIIGVLDAPARGEHWRAAAGCGASRNGIRLHASSRTKLPGARVPADVLPKGDADLIAVAKPNSIALRIAMVAADEADLLATLRWGHEWDIAAAALIAQEAGASVTDALGRPLRYNSTKGEMFGVLAASPAIHAAAVARLASLAEEAFVRRV
ncbi:3'(2'),5'-bisphosphate nucleotidase CysQ [Sphingomonas oleivorans]|uniref:3'(2'),5'-bisphosphate nucleotidase CysQ n=1 Tax=Sphingomonas oleivorans TaxID=1735121 RepID=A0A2T5FU64_9SPHN|nr:3'(2'),5'-bisphosphate nucleotidase CysQ [Sphingomonas oleivorans]PTQ07813.1 3'(2'),5'-bisphosphate nucleotidase CysQ [Sphingomonas oleivorans]